MMENIGLDISNTELLKQLVETIKTEGQQIRRELKKDLQFENKKIIEKIDTCCKNIKEIEEKLNQLESKCKYFDRKLRKNNILIFGLEISDNVELINVVLEKIRELTDIEITAKEINNLYTVPLGNKRAVKIEFVSYLKKNLLLKQGYKLKGTNISFAQDLSFEERQERKFLRKHQQIARTKNYLARIRGNKLVVNNETYSIEQLKQFDVEEDSIEIKSNISISPTHNVKPNSAPATPSVSQTFFEDSLHIFSLHTPQPLKETCHNIKEDNVNTRTKKKLETKIDEKGEENIRDHIQDNKKVTTEQSKVTRKTQEPIISKKTEHENKKTTNIAKERSNSASSYNSRIITRQQTNK